MCEKKIKVGIRTIYIYKESGNLYIRDKDGESRPILFGAYVLSEILCLRNYMNIMRLSLEDAVKVLNDCDVVLSGNCFNIYFHDEEAVEKFINATLNLKQNTLES